jgi:hypothetical protein
MEEIEENKPQKQYYAECIIIPWDEISWKKWLMMNLNM